jgi:hypothetical protein
MKHEAEELRTFARKLLEIADQIERGEVYGAGRMYVVTAKADIVDEVRATAGTPLGLTPEMIDELEEGLERSIAGFCLGPRRLDTIALEEMSVEIFGPRDLADFD